MALWTPSEISVSLWLDGSNSSTLFDATTGGSTPADAASVRRWEDLSGNANHAKTYLGTNFPTRKTAIINSLDVVRFSASVIEGISAALGSSDYAVYLIAKSTTTSSSAMFCQHAQTVVAGRLLIGADGTTALRGFFNDGTSSRSFLTTNAFADGNPRLASMRYVSATGGNTAVQVDADSSNEGSQTGTYTPLNTRYSLGNLNTSTFGFSASNAWNGDIGEVVVLVGSSHHESDHEKVQGYLAHKWGTEAQLPTGHPYKTSPPTIGSSSLRKKSAQKIIRSTF